MIKTQHKYLDFPPEYLHSFNKAMDIDGLFRDLALIGVFLIGMVIAYCVIFFDTTFILRLFRLYAPPISKGTLIIWGIAVIVIWKIVISFVKRILLYRQLKEIKDYQDIPFRSAQSFFSLKPAIGYFIGAICQNRPPFNERAFSALWKNEKEAAIAKSLVTYFCADDFYFLPEDHIEIVSQLQPIAWVMDLGNALQIEQLSEEPMTMAEFVTMCAEKTPLELDELKQLTIEIL